MPSTKHALKAEGERPVKKAKLLDSDSESDSGSESASESDSGGNNENEDHGDDGGVPVNGFQVNEAYARRFEYNKRREERDRLEEKYGNRGGKTMQKAQNTNNANEHEDDIEGSSDSSDSETEDDEGDLATTGLDAEIASTLQAIRARDPRVYDSKTQFYTTFDPESVAKPETDKPVFLRDYHRQNLLDGYVGDDGAAERRRPTYAEEQAGYKRDLIDQLHAAAQDGEDEEDDDAFLVTKAAPEGTSTMNGDREARMKHGTLNPAEADADPDAFLQSFMSSRAWIPTKSSKFQPFESEDEEDDARADAFEAAYNLRFEDPSKSNEALVSHARDAAERYSVRKDEDKKRRRARDRERQRKEDEKREREEERQRLKKLRVDEIEEKVQKIRAVAGLRKTDVVDLQEWRHFLDDGWDDAEWEREMQKKFGQAYYDDQDTGEISDGEPGNENDDTISKKKRHAKKPKWDDDIDIKDIVPDFRDADDEPDITLSDDEDEGDNEIEVTSKAKTSKDRKKDQQAAKSASRQQRRQIEALVDRSLPVDMAEPIASASSSKPRSNKKKDLPIPFSYRETSPQSFGLTSRDILFATDADLNAFAGLKTLASFRDPTKKRRDVKKLGKKYHLRAWRKEVFGGDGREEPWRDFRHGVAGGDGGGDGEGEGEKATREKKRRRKGKGKEKSSSEKVAAA